MVHQQRCQGCGGGPIAKAFSLGYMPTVNLMRKVGEPAKAETWLPTDVYHCSACDLVQLGYEAEPHVVFPRNYAYRSGTTKILRDNFADLAKEAARIVDLRPSDLVVDIGSNDGTLLSNFNARRIGVEPTDIGDLAIRDHGIETIKGFFDRGTGSLIAMNRGRAKVVTCCNCFAHMPNIGEVIEGIKEILAPGGVFVSESHYLMNLIDGTQYDTIYHEHLRYYSISSLTNLLHWHGLQVFHIKRIPTHGGSIRVYACRPGDNRIMGNVRTTEPSGPYLWGALAGFEMRMSRSRVALIDCIASARVRGRVVGIGAPSRASTVINYCRLDYPLIDYVCEVSSSPKVGHYMPGTSIPVVDEAELFRDQPAYAVLFSWHIADELIPKLRERGYRGSFILPISGNVIREGDEGLAQTG